MAPLDVVDVIGHRDDFELHRQAGLSDNRVPGNWDEFVNRPAKRRGMTRSVAAALVVGLIARSSSAAADRVDYQRQIKPVLAARCYACHGALKQKGGLRADTARVPLKEGTMVRRSFLVRAARASSSNG